MVAGSQQEVTALKAQQRQSMAKQMQLDEESLERLKEQKASKQVKHLAALEDKKNGN